MAAKGDGKQAIIDSMICDKIDGLAGQMEKGFKHGEKRFGEMDGAIRHVDEEVGKLSSTVCLIEHEQLPARVTTLEQIEVERAARRKERVEGAKSLAKVLGLVATALGILTGIVALAHAMIR